MVLTVLVAAILAVAGLWTFQRSLIFLPDRRQPPPVAEVLPSARDVTFPTADGLELGAWYLPALAAGGPTVLVAQGNGGSRADRADLARALAGVGFGVLLMDYRGYGGNPGSPSEDGLALDARAARDFLIERAGVPADSIVYLGESLGAAVVAELATEHVPAAMVLRSPFTSLADAGRAAYGVPVGWLLRDRFAVREHLASSADLPVAVVYGGADTIVPARLSREVAEAARAAGAHVVEVEVPGAGHNDPALAHGPDLVAALVEVAHAGGAAPTT